MNLCTGGGSLGLIDIAGGPIRWVNVRSVGEGDYVAEYGVPCEHAPVPNPRLTSVRVRTFPLCGSIVDVPWRVSIQPHWLGAFGAVAATAVERLRPPAAGVWDDNWAIVPPSLAVLYSAAGSGAGATLSHCRRRRAGHDNSWG